MVIEADGDRQQQEEKKQQATEQKTLLPLPSDYCWTIWDFHMENVWVQNFWDCVCPSQLVISSFYLVSKESWASMTNILSKIWAAPYTQYKSTHTSMQIWKPMEKASMHLTALLISHTLIAAPLGMQVIYDISSYIFY